MKAWVTLNAAPGVGPSRFHKILKAFGSPEKALGSGAAELGACLGAWGAEGAAEILAFAQHFDAQKELDLAHQCGAQVLTLRDPGYPPSLLQLYDPPPLLYVRGRLPEEGKRCLAVVGARQPTEYGLTQCRALIRDLAPWGIAIISGLARGIDAAAHQAALSSKLPTVGVLGSGLGAMYPAEHAALAEAMLAGGGAVLSQFSMQCPPERGNFPMRNGLVSGLSWGVLVIEGAGDSGSLITAEWALEQGREIFALPGRVDDLMSRGPLRLIQQGAKLVLGAADIVAEFPGQASAGKRMPSRLDSESSLPGIPAQEGALTGEEILIIAALKEAGASPVDALSGHLRMGAAALSATLTMLEIKGAIRKLPGSLVEAL